MLGRFLIPAFGSGAVGIVRWQGDSYELFQRITTFDETLFYTIQE
jgi:hypothetical protein